MRRFAPPLRAVKLIDGHVRNGKVEEVKDVAEKMNFLFKGEEV